MDAQMACDVVALCACRLAVLPLACETEIVGALAADVLVAEMVVKGLRVRKGGRAFKPLTAMRRCAVGRWRWTVVVDGTGGRRRSGHLGLHLRNLCF